MSRRRQQFTSTLSSLSSTENTNGASQNNVQANRTVSPLATIPAATTTASSKSKASESQNSDQSDAPAMHANVKSTVDSIVMASGETKAQVLVPKAGILTEEQEEDAYSALKQDEQKVAPPKPAEDEADTTCFICAEQIQYWSIGACGHATCHVCAIRLRVLYKKKECTFCKSALPTLYFSASPYTRFPAQTPRVGAGPALEPGELDVTQYDYVDEKQSIIFETERIMDDALYLLRYNCPSPSCGYQATSWDALESHTLAIHHSVLCHLCRRQLLRFAHEQVLYPPHLLPLHDPSRVPRGHRQPRCRGKIEEDMVAQWGPAHPMCEFCHEAFFSSDELLKHMKTKHEECFVCKEKGQRDVYFQNYDKMAAHFTQAHFPCTERSCLEQKFVVFGSEIDWKGHMVKEHNKSMSSRDKYAARQLPIDFVTTGSLGGEFSFSPSLPPPPVHNPNAQHRQNGPRHIVTEPQGQFVRQSGRSRTGAVQHQQLPQPPRDDRHNRRNGFGNALTAEEPQQGQGNKGKNKSGTSTPRIDEMDETSMANNLILDEVATLVEYSETKLSSFRHAIRSYKANEAPARDMVDTVFSVLNRDTDDTVRIIKSVANTMRSDEDKYQGILTAMASFNVDRQNEFPTLGGGPTPSISKGTGYSGIASGQVIRAKNTARPAGSATKIWDRVEKAAASTPAVPKPKTLTTNPQGNHVPGAAFPSLGSGSKSSSRTTTPAPSPSTWGLAASTGYVNAAQPIIRSVNMPTVQSSSSKPARPHAPSAAAFPGLPAASNNKERPNFARDEMVRRMKGDRATPQGNNWSSPPSPTDTPTGEEEEPLYYESSASAGGGAGGKKKKKGKEMLFTLGQTRQN